MNKSILQKNVQSLLFPGKGILAADESSHSIKKRLESYGIQDSLENRHAYRQLLLATPEINKYISGVILFDETFHQKELITDLSYPLFLKEHSILTGIKVDIGAKELAFFSEEKITEGLDGLRERFIAYKKSGASFAKWRAVIKIDKEKQLPTSACIAANIHALTRYACLAQEQDIIPIIEPEILLSGNHTIEDCSSISIKIWEQLIKHLQLYKVYLPGVILKASMIISGDKAQKQAPALQVAKMTVDGLKQSIPKELGGIVFLSGGQNPKQATLHLQLMNEQSDNPWPLTFSYGRALQEPALEIWSKDMHQVGLAQKALLNRCKLNGLASMGQYHIDLEE